MHSKASQHNAVVLWATGGVYRVLLDTQQQVEAALRGRLKLEQRTGELASGKEGRVRPQAARGSRGALDRVVAGDRVWVEQHEDGSHTIESVAPRKSELARTAPGRSTQRAKILVANVDQVVIVVAAARPEPNLRMLDRILVLAEMNDLPAVIVVNKLDLVDADDARARFRDYTAAEYDVLFMSVAEGAGIDELRQLVCGRESVVTGPSGAGKSSMLNRIEPSAALRTGEISEVVVKGRHTTVAAQLIPLTCGGFIVDTPGIREVGLFDLNPESLDICFPEFRALIGDCKFTTSCTHIHEPECAVRDAAHSGAISRSRFESYRDLYREAVGAG